MNEFFLSPSQAYQRFEELNRKREFDFLSLEEEEELSELEYVIRESSPDLWDDSLF
jgi:hypothetical protein